MRRYYRRKSDGAWCYRVDGNPIADKAASEAHATAEYGFAVEAVDIPGGAPMGYAPSLKPTPPPAPTDPVLDAIDGILAKADTDVTAADLKALALHALRRLRQRGRLT